MPVASKAEDFLRLRRRYPEFIFEKQEYRLDDEGLTVRFTFSIPGLATFRPELSFPRRDYFLPDEYLAGHLDNLVFQMGLIELVSYWKASCAPVVRIMPYSLDPEQVLWWKKLYFNGLGEFFYLNGIQADPAGFMEIVGGASSPAPQVSYRLSDGVIIPVGGGKDSAVTLELLGHRPGSIPMIMNPRGASLSELAAAGIKEGAFIEVRRRIDPALLELNERGFLNGHTPFSAMLAFTLLLAAVVSGRRHIALSNESSASEATVPGTEINHQYSKSLQFESDFRDYIRRWISPDLDYFSFLRPLNELQIASLFAGFPAHHPVFRSCNAGSKTDSWCGHCAKCLFTWCMLSPFLSQERLTEIFGCNLPADGTLVPLLDQLSGLADEKPFDCVGTIREVNVALCETIRQAGDRDLPVVFQHYRQSVHWPLYSGIDFQGFLKKLSGPHFLAPEFLEILQSTLK